MNKEKLIAELLSTQQLIKDTENDTTKKVSLSQKYVSRMTDMENETTSDVANAKKEGTDMPLYPNDISRKSEIAKRLSENSEYLKLRDIQIVLRDEIKTGEAQLRVLYSNIGVLKTIARLISGEE